MTQPTGDSSDLRQRIVTLEEAVMHNERLLAKLDTVVREVHDRLDEQARQLGAFKKLLEDLQKQEPEERSFEDERPPHY